MQQKAGELLAWLRDALMWASESLAVVFPFEATKIYWFILIVGALMISRKLIKWIPKVSDSYFWWAVIAAIIIYLINFL